MKSLATISTIIAAASLAAPAALAQTHRASVDDAGWYGAPRVRSQPAPAYAAPRAETGVLRNAQGQVVGP